MLCNMQILDIVFVGCFFVESSLIFCEHVWTWLNWSRVVQDSGNAGAALRLPVAWCLWFCLCMFISCLFNVYLSVSASSRSAYLAYCELTKHMVLWASKISLLVPSKVGQLFSIDASTRHKHILPRFRQNKIVLEWIGMGLFFVESDFLYVVWTCQHWCRVATAWQAGACLCSSVA